MSNPTAASATPPKPRRRGLRGLLVFLLVFIGLPAGYYFYASWSLERELAEVIAETDRLDPRWRLEDIEADRKKYRNEGNAALQVIKFSKLWTGSSPAAHRHYAPLFDDHPAQVELNLQQTELLRQEFDKYTAGLIEARKLKDMPSGGRFPIAYKMDWLSTDTSQLDARKLFIVLDLDAMLRAQDGDLDGAIESCIALANAVASYGDEPSLLACSLRNGAGSYMLVWIVERCLAQGFPKEESLTQLQRRLAREAADARAHFVNAMRGERAGHHRLYLAMQKGTVQPSRFVEAGKNWSFLQKIADQLPVFTTRHYPQHLRYMNELVAATRLSLHEQMNRYETLQRSAPQSGIFAGEYLSIQEYYFRNHAYAQARLACAETGLACECFRIAHDRWPDSIAELVKAKLLEGVPTDPYDGQPLRLAKRKDGITIYSVGKDKEDNGGNIDPSRGAEPGTDIGFRLWNPKSRRQPPRPPVTLEK